MSAKRDRKAYYFSGASCLLLLAFVALYGSGIFSPNKELSYLIIVLLVISTAIPFLVKGWDDNGSKEESFSGFADLLIPSKKEFSFEVPTLPSYKKIQPAPARIAMSLCAFLLVLTFAGGSVMSTMLNIDIPFLMFGILASTSIIIMVCLVALFIAATTRELKLRRIFHDEVITGFASCGYHPVRSFNAENTDSRKVLLGDGYDHYEWWEISFEGDKAQMVWANTRNLSSKNDKLPQGPTNHT